MKTLSKEQARSLFNWIEQNQLSNWGVWGNYPDLPVSASYNQYDNAQLVIKLHQPLLIDGEKANYIIGENSRHAPGKGHMVHYNKLKLIFQTEDEKLADKVISWKKDYKHAMSALDNFMNAINMSDEDLAEIAIIDDQFTAIDNSEGTTSKQRRKMRRPLELMRMKYPCICKINSWSGWMTDAMRFDSEQEYIQWKIQNHK